MSPKKLLLAGALLVAVAAAIPVGTAAAKPPKIGTWTSFDLSTTGFGQQILLDTTTGAAQVGYSEANQPKTYAMPAPQGAPVGAVGTYTLGRQAIFVNFGMGDQPTIVLLHTATGASWYFNAGTWSPVIRTTS